MHPFPSLVPNPTKNPPSKYPYVDTIVIPGSVPVRSSSVKKVASMVFETIIKTDRNSSFHDTDGSVNDFRGDKIVEETMPLAPKISPAESKRKAAAAPMREPPAKPNPGVK